jgi:sporulation protein YlmC with PRC-barrel domain
MIRTLMASSAMLALMTAGAIGVSHAQTQQPADAAQPPAMTQETQAPATDSGAATQAPATDAGAQSAAQPSGEVAKSDTALTPDEPTLATAFMGKPVYSGENPDSDKIGDVNDLIIDDKGAITHAVVGVGGFLGIGEKDVAVPFDELQVVEQEGDLRLIYAASREQLEQAEKFDRTAYEPESRARADQQQAAATSGAGGTTTVPATGSASSDMAAASSTNSSDSAAVNTVTTDQSASATSSSASAEQKPAEASAGTDNTDQQTADAAATAGTASSTDTAAGTSPSEQQTAQTSEPAAPAAGATAGAAASGDGGFMSFSADQQIRASTMMGKEIYGADNESIGEVSDLVMQEDGKTRAALIDVGGFLGVGEKEVAIPFDQIQVTKEGDEPRLTVAMTKEQLEQAPAFERQQQTAAQQTGQPAAGTAADQTQQAAGTEQPAAGQAAGNAQFAAATQDLTAENLIGSDVVDPNEKEIGEVEDVVFNPQGNIEAVVLDVGGFLGMGEKPVAITFDQLNIQKGDGDDLRIQVNATEEQLKNAPAYDTDSGTAK